MRLPTIPRLLTAALSVFLATSAGASAAEDTVVATVNGTAITETDLKYADIEIGGDLGRLPPETRRRVLVEFLIENQLLAEAAKGQELAKSADYDRRMQYWQRRALRDTYFESKIQSDVSEQDAKAYYDTEVAKLKPDEEVKAAHILVEDEAKAKELVEKIAHDGDFAELAKQNSIDPGSKDSGGSLGFFGRGQMVPEFEEAAFGLKQGEVSPPVKSQFGWHIIKLEERRTKEPPPYETLKDRVLASLIHRKAQEVVKSLREKAQLEYVDPEIKKQVEAEKPGAEGAAKEPVPAPKP